MAFKVACVGIGGFARNYVSAALTLQGEGKVRLAAAADPFAERNPETVAALRSHDVRLYRTIDELLAAEKGLDLVTIGTGLHLHGPMALAVLKYGAHVFLAKPSTVTVQSVDRMIEAAEVARRVLAIDFQHSYTEGAQAIKQAIADGRLGRVERVSACLIWRRGNHYYTRTPWAGRVKLGDDYVLDGPMNNPHAHYLNNALYFACPQRRGFAAPVRVQAELYRSHAIDNEDTACLRAATDSGAEILIASTLSGQAGPDVTDLRVHGSKGQAAWAMTSYAIRPAGGEPVEKSFPRSKPIHSFRQVVDCIQIGGRPTVSIADTRSHVLLTNGAYESARTVRTVPPDYIDEQSTKDNDVVPAIRAINSLARQAAAEHRLFSELGVPWAQASPVFDLAGYQRFALDLERTRG